jgi:uncharacterized protein (TIGR00297 family)
VTSTVRRAGAFALVGTLTFVVPFIERAFSPALTTILAASPFVLTAVLALSVIDEGRVFDLFARPGDRRDGKLYGLAGFALSVAVLSLLATQFALPMGVFVASVLILVYGNLGERFVRQHANDTLASTAGFGTAGFAAGIVGQLYVGAVLGIEQSIPFLIFLAASGTLLGALLRAALFERDDPLVLISIGLFLWLFVDLAVPVTTMRITVAMLVTAILGYLSYTLETASIPGMLTGILLGLLTIVLGGDGWFVMLIAFFGIGGLSSKYRYQDKQRRGIAEDNEGARGTGNVLANSLTALVAVLAHEASPSHTQVDPHLFLFAFAGAVAAAMSDTLSSEIGGLFDRPRLITTLEPVDPGTDGGVTLAGEIAGLVGATFIAAIAIAFALVDPFGGAIIVAAGFIGMTVDSLLGATLEGAVLGNQSVNFLATVAAALAGMLLAAGFGLI